MADAPTDEQMAEKLKEFGLTSFKTDPISAALKFYEWYAAQVAPPKLKAPDREGVWLIVIPSDAVDKEDCDPDVYCNDGPIPSIQYIEKSMLPGIRRLPIEYCVYLGPLPQGPQEK